MSVPNKYSPQTNLQPPRCPHCSGSLEQLERWQWDAQISAGVVIIFAIMCPNAECHKLLGSQIMIVPRAEESVIARPS